MKDVIIRPSCRLTMLCSRRTNANAWQASSMRFEDGRWEGRGGRGVNGAEAWSLEVQTLKFESEVARVGRGNYGTAKKRRAFYLEHMNRSLSTSMPKCCILLSQHLSTSFFYILLAHELKLHHTSL